MSHVDGSDDGVGYGVFGESISGLGVKGHSQSSTGVAGGSRDGFGVAGVSGNSAGLYGESFNDYAAVLNGKVKITGNLEKLEAHLR
jgi:hypothetical protein